MGYLQTQHRVINNSTWGEIKQLVCLPGSLKLIFEIEELVCLHTSTISTWATWNTSKASIKNEERRKTWKVL